MKMTSTTASSKECSDTRQPTQGRPGKCILLLLLHLYILWLPLTRAGQRCNKCYHTVYQSRRNSYKIKHSFRAHTYVNPFCYNLTALSTCTEGDRKYWIGRNIGTQDQQLKGECPAQEDWLYFNFHHINSKEDIINKRPYEIDLVREIVVNEKEKQKEENSLVLSKNLFIDLAERIGRQLNLTNCWVCGGTLESDTWPWQGVSIGPLDLIKLDYLPSHTRNDREEWLLRDTVVGEECIWRKGDKFTQEVGETICKRYLVTNGQKSWWLPKGPDTFWSRNKVKGKTCIHHPTEQIYQCWDSKSQPYSVLPPISKYWTSASNTRADFWGAPHELYWICGKKAYSQLPSHWRGSCTLGAIQPSFFLLSEEAGEHLGIPLYDELHRTKRYVIGGTQRWGNEEWTPERILETYGPATWAQDGSWGYRTPIYMLNRIIRLQALIEIISNQSTLAIDLLSDQHTQTRAAVYQNRLALDYLLAEEGGVCGKFNTSDCCLHIDDHGEAIAKITQNIRKLTHVPVQKWYPLTTGEWWKNMFSGEWWKKALIIIGFSFAGLLFLPCLIPCFVRLITSVVEGMPQFQNYSANQSHTQPPPKIMEIKSSRRKRNTARVLFNQFRQLDPIEEELSTFV